MIGWLQGRVLYKQNDQLLINVCGVGYELTVPQSVMASAQVGEELTVFVHHVQREDGQFLYGFSSFLQRQLFRELIRVSGIGPKLSIVILSGLTPEALIAAVRAQESAPFLRLSGIGKKTAERLLIELHDRVEKNDLFLCDESESSRAPIELSASEEAIQALIALELAPAEAELWVKKAQKTLAEDADSAVLIKTAFALRLQGAK